MKNSIIKSLEDLASHEATKRKKGFQFKIAMYRKAIKAFRSSNIDPKNFNEAEQILATVFKNPQTIASKIKELYNTGKISEVDKARTDPISKAITLLSSVPQIGPIKAMSLVTEYGIYTVNQLKRKEYQYLLYDKQKLGLKYYDELIDPKTLDAVRIPRKEVQKFEKIVKKQLPKDLTLTICGSYRRGAVSSGDIDCLFTGNKSSFKQLVETLSEKEVIKDPFSAGSSKWMGMGKVDKLHRRIDLMYIDSSEYPFAILYFTGSQEFNEAFRGYCRKLGYTLNEHGIKSLQNGENVNKSFKSEKDIFDFLNVPYVEPEDRNSGKFTLPNVKMSSVKVKAPAVTKKVFQPTDLIHCLKGKGQGGFSIQEIRDIADNKGISSSGTKKDICARLFKNSKETPRSQLFNVSRGVLLANTYKNNINPKNMIASEKFNGIRAVWNGKQLKSRTNKPIYAPNWFLKGLPKNHALNGELFLKRGAFEATTSIVSKKIPVDEEWKNIRYMVFDLPSSSEPFKARLGELKNIVKTQCSKNGKCPLIVPKHTTITSRNQMKEMFNNIVSKGGEGIMLRNPNAKYQQKRSKNLLKVKPTNDAEAIIINMIEGKGKDEGRMGAIKVKHKKSGVEFKIGTGFTAAMRQDFWNKKNNLKGNMVTFGYKGLTAKGVPRHPTFIRMRKNKNL